MALSAPNPALATETVTINGRVLTDDESGGQYFSPGATATYAAIVTMQVDSRNALLNRAGKALSESFWDVLIFTSSDPGVKPQSSTLAVSGQSRTLVAIKPSTARETGCWYVLCKSIE